MTANIVEMVPTRGTDERFAVRHLVDHRGGPFVVAFFRGVADEAILADVYYGRPIPQEAFKAIKRLMKERLAHDLASPKPHNPL